MSRMPSWFRGDFADRRDINGSSTLGIGTQPISQKPVLCISSHSRLYAAHESFVAATSTAHLAVHSVPLATQVLGQWCSEDGDNDTEQQLLSGVVNVIDMEELIHFHRPDISFTSGNEPTVQSIPQLIDFNAKYNADYTFCIQAEKPLLENSPSFLRVTNAQLKRAICCCAQWLKSSVQEMILPQIMEGSAGTRKGPPIALLLDSDINLLIHIYTFMSLGVPVLLLSARLSPAAAQHLLRETSARALIHSTRSAYKAKEIVLASQKHDGNSIRLYKMNDMQVWFDSTSDAMDISRSICQPGYDGGDSDRNVVILHSSGTTGLPKPVYTSQKYMLSFATCHAFSSEESAQRLVVSTLPLYHGFGLVTPALSLGIGRTFCIPMSSVNPTAASILQLIDLVHAKCLITVPSILEEIVHDALCVRTLTQLDFVAFGGGSMKPAIGQNLASAGVNLLNHFGSTESGPLAPIFVPGPNYEWQYFRLRRDIKLRVELNSTSNDTEEQYKLIAYPPGWDEPFELQDRFVTSPRNPMIDFSAIGRLDSVIVLATGEKVQPTIIETMLSEHPLVQAAIAFGDGHFQLGVIVQPLNALSSDNLDEFIVLLWPTILEANELTDAHGRIASRDAIIVVPHTVTLPRSDKGSLLRRELYATLDGEIEEVYQRLESSALQTDCTLVIDYNGDIKQQVKDLIQNVLLNWNIPAQDWTISDDLFKLGMDSLQAVEVRRLLLPSIGSAESIPRDFVYRHPSVLELSETIKAMHCKQELAQPVDVRQRMVDDFVEQYTLPSDQPGCTPRQTMTQKYRRGEERVVMLTGSTGSLGCHLVAHLANLPIVKEVICLVRPAIGRDQDPSIRQDEALRGKQIILSPEVSSKITTIQATLSLPRLGLTSEIYGSLLGRVTHLLHNAWPMNFNTRLSSFESQFQAVHNLLRLALDASNCDVTTSRMKLRNPAKFIFVSSIAVVGEHPNTPESFSPILEVNIRNVIYTNRIGYAEAKLVCERIVERARDDFSTNFEAGSVRIGQISGSTESGYWNSDEHMAALIKSSVTTHALPALEGTLSWLPVNVAAASLSDILLSEVPRSPMSGRSSGNPEPDLLSPIYHLENPVRWPWEDILRVLASLLPQQNPAQASKLPLIPYSAWLDNVVHLGDTITTRSDVNHSKQRKTTSTDEAFLEKDRMTSSDTSQLEMTRYTGKGALKHENNPAYNLAKFFATDFRRMSCGSIVLDTRLAYDASANLREFVSIAGDAAVRDQILERYVGYWRRCGFL